MRAKFERTNGANNEADLAQKFEKTNGTNNEA